MGASDSNINTIRVSEYSMGSKNRIVQQYGKNKSEERKKLQTFDYLSRDPFLDPSCLIYSFPINGYLGPFLMCRVSFDTVAGLGSSEVRLLLVCREGNDDEAHEIILGVAG